MRSTAIVCLGFTIALMVSACEPPAKVAVPTQTSSVNVKSPAKSSVVPSAMASPKASAMTVAATAPSVSATMTPPTPCPPEVPVPTGVLAWVSGCRILLNDKIYFDTDKDKLKPQSFPLLDAIGDVLAANPDVFVEIQGHLGQRNQHAYGRKLTQNRAEAVQKYLVAKKGIASDRLEARGYEDSVPIADWRTEAGRLQNRRIDFVIWKWRGGTTRIMWPVTTTGP